MDQFHIFPRSSEELIAQIAKNYGIENPGNILEGDGPNGKLKIQSIRLSNWIDISLAEFHATKKIELVRKAIPDTEIILFTLSNYSTFGSDNQGVENVQNLKIKSIGKDCELFVSNSLQDTHIIIDKDHSYKFITFRIHKKEFLRYQDIHKTEYKDVVENSKAFSFTHFVPKKMEVLMNKMFDSENLLGWHSLMQKSLSFELLADIIMLLRTNSPVLHKDIDAYKLKLLFSIQSFLLKNLDQNINLKALAAQFHISESKLHKLFKSILMMSPHHYIINERLKKSKDLLLYSEMTISEITYNLGFNSPSHFTASFKKKYGMTPAHARKTSGIEKRLES